MPYTGTCIGGPMDGRVLTLRRLHFIAVNKPDLLYWVYRGDDPADTFTLDLTLTPQEEADGLNADGTWGGERPFTLQVQQEMWANGLDVLSVPPPPPPAPSLAEEQEAVGGE